jgi:hypothetical protein
MSRYTRQSALATRGMRAFLQHAVDWLRAGVLWNGRGRGLTQKDKRQEWLAVQGEIARLQRSRQLMAQQAQERLRQGMPPDAAWSAVDNVQRQLDAAAEKMRTLEREITAATTAAADLHKADR